MRWVALLQILLLGCHSSSDTSGPRAALQVSFGSAAPASLAAAAMSNQTSSRLMVQASDGHITVFVSLAIPIQAQQIALSPDSQKASIWAKQDSTVPLIATAGTLTIDNADSLLTFDFADVSKPADSMGTSILINGSITGVKPP